jgi:AraC-like DNA-binding protein
MKTDTAAHDDLQGDLELARDNLVARLERHTRGMVVPAPSIPALSIFRFEAPSEPQGIVQVPSVCIIAQGAKRVLLGEEIYDYDPDHFLITAVGLPVVAQVTSASRQTPYLGLKLELDLGVVARMMVDSEMPSPRPRTADRSMAVGRVTAPLLNAFDRLVALLDHPADAPILAPLVKKEIVYRLLVSEQGTRLRQIASAGSHSQQIARAIDWLQANFTAPFRVEDLAGRAGMSTSAFHHHFRAMTAMTPLRYQKWLRLNEARKLMLTRDIDAATASFHVGYGSPSQFSREYRRLFGAPPLRDIRALQHDAGGETTR